MKECPGCKTFFSESDANDNGRFHDEIMKELLRRQKTSDLCLGCLMEEWATELGEAELQHPHRTYAKPEDDRQQQTIPHPRIL